MKRHFLDRPATVRWLWMLLAASLGVLVALDIWAHPHSPFPMVETFAFHTWFGFLACAAIIAVSKTLGIFLKRPDDYYARDGEAGESEG